MNMKYMVMAGLLLSQIASADDWICKEESSMVKGNTIKACGVGTDKDENEARTQAFNNAKAEFDRVCNASDNCKDHEVTVEPKRTTCDSDNGQTKCYRMVEFTFDSTKVKAHSSDMYAEYNALHHKQQKEWEELMKD